MQQSRLRLKFRQQRQLQLPKHCLKILRIFLAFQLIMIPLNCLGNMSYPSHILTPELWTSQEVINSNLCLLGSFFFTLPFVIYYELEKSQIIGDQMFTVGLLHVLLVLAYNHSITIKLVLFILVLSAVTGFIGYSITLRSQNEQLMKIVCNLERGTTNPQHTSLVNHVQDLIQVELLT